MITNLLDPRGTVDLVGNAIMAGNDALADGHVPENVIIAAKTDRGRWIEAATRLIGLSRARIRSTYFQWAMAINGLHVAAEKYMDPEWASKKSFFISGLGPSGLEILANWKGPKAAEAHLSTVTKMSAWGYVEMYAALEGMVFEFYKSYLNFSPDSIIKGDEFRLLRRMRRDAASDPEKKAEWESAWKDRLKKWQRKRVYDGLHCVFLAYCKTAGLRTPSTYTRTTVETWAETMEGLSMVRHLLVHGETVVPPELEAIAKKPHFFSVAFKAGEPLVVDLQHLQRFELFTEQLLDGLNIALVEHADAGQ